MTATDTSHNRGSSWLPLVVIATGQLVSWGTLYYGITFLAAPMQASTGWQREFIFVGYSVALLLSGLVLPWVGRLIQRRGARFALTAGMLFSCAGFLIIAFGTGPVAYMGGWAVNGVAMAFSLYETAFSAVNELRRVPLRKAVGIVTIVGGLASTAFWPITAFLVEETGWRNTLVAFAAIHLLLLAPLYWRFLPPHATCAPLLPAAPMPTVATDERRRMIMFSAAFGAFALVSGGLVAHLALIMGGIEPDAFLLALVLIGPAQIALRIVDVFASPGRKIFSLGFGSALALAAGSLFLVIGNGQTAAAVAFAVLFGMANGGMTIARGVVPREYFASRDYALTLSTISRSTVVMRSLGPVLSAVGFTVVTVDGMLLVHVFLALGAAALFFFAANMPAKGHQKSWE